MTPYGAQLQHQQNQLAAHRDALDAHRENAEAWQRNQDAKASLARTSKHALIWSGAGALLCCAFVPSTVGIVMGMRARKMAKEYGLVLPATATIGLILGVVGVLMGAGLITVGIIEGIKRDDRLAAISQQLGDSASKQELAHRTACLLAERRLLQGGFRDDKSVDEFECDGKLTVDGDQASLDGIRFERGGDLLTVTACLERGKRWAVGSFRVDASCAEPDDTARGDVSGKKDERAAEPSPSSQKGKPGGSASGTQKRTSPSKDGKSGKSNESAGDSRSK
jgi:hypothetical protein